MAFKETQPDFQMIAVDRIDPDPAHPRRAVDDAGLKGLVTSIRAKGLIQPVIVQPADANGRHLLIVGQRRWRAAILAGEKTIPALIRPCDPEEAIELQVFENLGQGVRAQLDTREMATAIQKIAQRFATPEEAAEHFGRSASWLSQATAVANLSPQVSALLESGQISSCTTAVQLDKLAQKDEAQAATLIEQLQDGEKLPKEVVEKALTEAGVTRRKARKEAAHAAAEAQPAPVTAAVQEGGPLPWEETPASTPVPDEARGPAPAAAVASSPAPANRRVNPGKVKRVAEMLGVAADDEEAILARLIDEFLALKGA